MPEGHTIHRLAGALRELWGGQRLRASSPQGRFAEGAARLNGQVLLDARAHGKHLFVPFGPAADMPVADPAVLWLRIHLGLYGSWTFDGDAAFIAPHAIGAPRRRVGERGEQALPGGAEASSGAPEVGEWQAPAPRGTVRLRLVGEHGCADLTGPAACELLDAAGVDAVRRRLGPDPLRRDGDREVFVANVRRRRRSIGELLMDQSVLAGAGNIYRAETLLRCGVNPFRHGNAVSERRLRQIWDDLVPLMEHGVETGLITTVDAADMPDPLPAEDQEAGRWYVYHRDGRPCLKCGARVQRAELAGRTLFWCPRCQAH
ncbi:Formamidopyrimidine-DNA glycosylase [Actinomyces bovis]|uniref:DNA-(apurinic or apyrimidinic site) lyase n=1 Tax=Actinomyces bovis TaxID=1658 RepID=A0ABY1VKR8_9ACTO|nr:zinc finger domain-containing protein [Actinomyces bovis]SPT52699.1 Formamidopyrimidine-DNA glycosylase [Actinomyces bovis]VEG54642.1 Formamidopyrimidine-DNA glycosylase [Actinomyces israelii]